jgi:FKBP-type peptidyl-prolyl cis-trans isomerase FkpA
VLLLSIVLVSCSARGTAAGDLDAYKAYLEKPSKDFLKKAAATPGAIRTPSGLVYRELKVGTGGSPKNTDLVTYSYHGASVEGIVFAPRPGPDSGCAPDGEGRCVMTSPFNQLTLCFSEGLQRMKVGGESQLVCPDVSGGATLIFDVALLAISGD